MTKAKKYRSKPVVYELKLELDAAVEGLRFYADKKIYISYANHGDGDESEATDDSGAKARAVLAMIERGGEKC